MFCGPLCSPVADLLSTVKQILTDIRDYKYLGARDAYNSLLVAIADQKALMLLPDYEGTLFSCASQLDEVNALLEENEYEIRQMVKRAAEVEDALRSVSLENGSGKWKLGAHMFEIATHYSVRDDNLLDVHIEGNVDDLPLFEQLAVVTEIDMYKTWVPFCNRSSLIKRIGPGELAGHFKLTLPFLARESAMMCYGADCLYEHDCVVLNGKSICCSGRDNDTLDAYEEFKTGDGDEEITIPFEEKPFSFCRKMDIKEIRAIFSLKSPTCAKVYKYSMIYRSPAHACVSN